MDFEEGGFYYSSSGEEVEYLDGVEEVAKDGGGDNEEPDYAAVSRRLQKQYKILKADGIRQLVENDISSVSTLLSVSRGVACTLLCRNNWNPSSVYDEWFADDRGEPIGILGKRKSRDQVCNICYENITSEKLVFTDCDHPFCADCWKAYIATSINDGPRCLSLICPQPECKATIGLELVDSLASVDDRDKYYEYLCRSYVEGSKSRKWCPAPGCNLAVELFDAGECESYDVTCDCSCKFCWKCTEEHHRPVDCKTVAEWLQKNSSEGMNTMWIVANTKPCPNCQSPIEKNQGCNNMRCTMCGIMFCWMCLKPLREHKVCNGYKEKEVSAANERRMDVKKHLERYLHYYERWDSNDRSRKRALTCLDRARNKHVETLASLQGVSDDDQLKFVTKAWQQIVECRRILKWTYAYGYYSSSLECSAKMDLFEFLQGQAEAALEKLHYCAEKETGEYLRSPREDFNDFRSKLTGLTAITKNYFENLVRALENNLSEVESCSKNYMQY